jgi:hypothetical protein
LVAWCVEVHADPVGVLFGDTDLVQESDDLLVVETHFHAIHSHLLLSEIVKRVWLFHHDSHFIAHLVSNLNLASVFHFLWIRCDLLLQEAACHLFWDFGQHLFCKEVRISLVLVEWYELDDISLAVLIEFLREEWGNITIELLHLGEICIANTNYDDRKWLVRCSDDLVDCLIEVIDYSISQNQTQVILLIVLTNLA